jgi:hypothetical protein
VFEKIIKYNSEYQRPSKTGLLHTYTKTKTVAVFTCDCCNISFQRDLGKMDRKRLSNDYYHVCPDCNAKKFAQQKGVERRRIWNIPANSDLDISTL